MLEINSNIEVAKSKMLSYDFVCSRQQVPAESSSPICFAVFKFMNNSNLVGNPVGTSAGLAPLRILSTCTGIRLYTSWRLGP